ncbi:MULTISPECIES: TetR/AcrR family transcriptional regulator [unclassified Sphingomonas]|uniref:TetR/AcrR family transcriptional regulator n=1 Tax=unclassified Sphingomonas TaxID=196159 RepID=UPI00082ECFA6|nr:MULTISPECIES: TetR/AcrR family transcriptional regulator [unclassified Sphingomonas]MCH4893648.1 TetR family transcriptional regulator [Sphingomonas sp. SFZ2018-12]
MRERKKAQRRQEIMRCAKSLFVRHGYASVLFDDIALAADVSVGTVYNYFPTKSELLFSLFEAEARDLADTVTKMPLRGTLEDQIVGTFEQAFSAISHIEPVLWRHVVAEVLLAPETFVKRWLVVEDHLTVRIGEMIARERGDIVAVGPALTATPHELGRAFYAIGKAGFYAYIGISHHDKEAALATMFQQLRWLASALFGTAQAG